MSVSATEMSYYKWDIAGGPQARPLRPDLGHEDTFSVVFSKGFSENSDCGFSDTHRNISFKLALNTAEGRG